VVGIVTTPDGGGYWLVSAKGNIWNYGDATWHGSAGSLRLPAAVVAIAATPDGAGYWLVDAKGDVYNFGDAVNYGSEAGKTLPAPIVALAATPDGHGYWLVSSKGVIYNFGDAGNYGSEAGKTLPAPIVALAATPDGHGYWLVSSKGVIYNFGDAGNFGSEGGKTLPGPVVGIVPTPDAFTTYYRYLVPGTTKLDGFGDVGSVTNPLGEATSNTYDPNRNPATVRDPNGNLTQFVYDFDNEQKVVIRPNGTSTSTSYTLDGMVATQVDGAGHVTAYTYTPRDQVATVTDPDKHLTSYTYDLAGNLLTTTDPLTHATTHAYDADNELTGITYSDGTTRDVTGITYDADGQRTGMTDGSGTWSYSYDSLHRMTAVTEGTRGTVAYNYDLNGNQISIKYPDGKTVTRAYDDANRFRVAKDWLGKTTTFTYDADGNDVTDHLGNGVIDSYTYNDADQLTTITDKSGATTLFSASYGRDHNAQVSSDNSAPPGAGPAYGYTSLNQLCYAGIATAKPCSSASSTSYGYDKADNLITTPGGGTQAFDPANELCWTTTTASTNACSSPPSGATTFTYNADGDRRDETKATASTTFAYDQADRLVSYTPPSGTATTYAYNGNGLRTGKTTARVSTGFAWDVSGGLPLLLAQVTGGTSTDFVYGPGGLALEQVTGTTAFYLSHDQLGSTRLLTNGAGAKAASYSFDPYGATASHAGTATTPLLYAGQYFDQESRLYYMRARYYDPATGQFLTVDPVVASTKSRYGYVAGNPDNHVDPLGRDSRTPDMREK
jgi:RHS repeat-associated protein